MNLIKFTAEWMIADLEHNQLTVTTMPAPQQRHTNHKIRVVESPNPEWYRELCAEYPRERRDRNPKYTDSVITRRETLAALVRIADGSRSGIYEDRLMPYVYDQAGMIAAIDNLHVKKTVSLDVPLSLGPPDLQEFDTLLYKFRMI